MLEDIKKNFLDMLNLRSLLDIQMENSRRYWIYKSGVKEEDGAGNINEIPI